MDVEHVPIDWDGELEAVHENGAVLPVNGYGGCPGYIADFLPGGWICFDINGASSTPACPWHIRNVDPDVSALATARALAARFFNSIGRDADTERCMAGVADDETAVRFALFLQQSGKL